jgi:hypothetical protein
MARPRKCSIVSERNWRPNRRTKVRAWTIACFILTILAFDVQTAASADELVKFDSAAYIMGQIQQRQARERGETSANAPAETVDGYLSKPDGDGPFPAVVYLLDAVGSRKAPAVAWLNL